MPSCFNMSDSRPGPSSFFRSFTTVNRVPTYSVPWLPEPRSAIQRYVSLFRRATAFTFRRNSLPFTYALSNTSVRYAIWGDLGESWKANPIILGSPSSDNQDHPHHVEPPPSLQRRPPCDRHPSKSPTLQPPSGPHPSQ